MGNIVRQPTAAARDVYDVIIIGGGVYGTMLAMEAGRRKLKSLLLEKDDFGGATTANSLRIIHGGLRYLQSVDLPRYRESVEERRWFLKTYPHLVRPLSCLMPLYGNGFHRPSILRFALGVNDLLSFYRNRHVPPDRKLPGGMVISARDTKEAFPFADVKGLKAGAVWHDAFVENQQRVIMTTLLWSAENGMTALNYVEATELITSNRGVEGVIAVDRNTATHHEFRSRTVVNAAGPWSRELASSFDRDIPDLFRGSIAWNILLNRTALSRYALAVTPKTPMSRTLFLLPWKGMLLAGTGHVPGSDISGGPTPSKENVRKFIEDINLALPGIDIEERDILRVFSGFLPVRKEGGLKLTTREVIIDHGKHGGPKGLYSVSGIKLTTSRCVAEKMMNLIFPERTGNRSSVDIISPENAENTRGIFDFHWYPDPNDSGWIDELRTLIDEESILHLDDLILRRTSIGDNPERALKIAPAICDLFGWDESRSYTEISRLEHIFRL